MSDELEKTSQDSSCKKTGIFHRISPRKLLSKSRSLNNSPERILLRSPQHRQRSSSLAMFQLEIERKIERELLTDLAEESNNKSISGQEYQRRLRNSPPITPRDITPSLSPRSVSSTSSRNESGDEWLQWYLGCEYCKRQMEIKRLEPTKKVYFLAIKCTCNEHKYFCSRLCHRSHWLNLAISERRCEMFYFKNIPNYAKVNGEIIYLNVLDEPLTWRDVEYIHLLDEYME